MSTTYLVLARFAQTWGLVYFAAVFLLVLIYALWPARRRQFEEAARIPRLASRKAVKNVRCVEILGRSLLQRISRNKSHLSRGARSNSKTAVSD